MNKSFRKLYLLCTWMIFSGFILGGQAVFAKPVFEGTATQSSSVDVKKTIVVSADQTSTLSEEEKRAIEEKVNQQNLINSLSSALSLVEKSKIEFDANKGEINKVKSRAEIQALAKEQTALQETLNKNQQNFVQLATGGLISMTEGQDYQEPSINWQEEVADLLKPLFSELKALTAPQRTKEALKEELRFYTQRADDLAAAKERVDTLVSASSENSNIVKKLKVLNSQLSERLEESQSHVDVLTVKFKELEEGGKSKSWLSRVKGIFGGMFFHLFLSLVAGIATYYAIKFLVDLLNKVDTQKSNNVLFITRGVQFVLRMLAILMGIGIYSVVLVSLGEWALMSVSVIFIFGLMLSLKDILPTYLAEMRTILNMGSIREGERIMYHGIPWTVKNLDFYTEIHNRDLGSTLRLPIAEVADLKSRSSVKSELWFPTRLEDYVVLSDGMYGQVIRQSPDWVLIDRFGSLISYQTADFLAAKPQNLSRQRFRVVSHLGIDYKYQSEATTGIVTKLKSFLEAELKKTDFVEFVTDVVVEFELANSSSLDYILVIGSKGSGAMYYRNMERWLQKAAVDCCNKYGWEIPFQQVVMHQPKSISS